MTILVKFYYNFKVRLCKLLHYIINKRDFFLCKTPVTLKSNLCPVLPPCGLKLQLHQAPSEPHTSLTFIRGEKYENAFSSC